ncbi:MAG TPA: cation-transporting P-type ATPase [Chloroflexia bacterium]|nr:cation-transporting P-type ATPase [Chloroflexia bacterium]
MRSSVETTPQEGYVLQDSLYKLPVAEAYAALDSQPEGLTDAEAARRLTQFGPNTIKEVKKKSLVWQFAAQFTHIMALLLWAGGLVGFLAQMPQLGFAIWSVNLINGAFSFWQEFKAEKAVEALRRLLPGYSTVRRGGAEKRILSEELVPGDLLLLAEGDNISADARLVEESELRVDQSTLTGESRPVRKTCEPITHPVSTRAETGNLVFAGTNVATGTALALVIATNMHTEFGKIAHLTQSVIDTESPLQKQLRNVTRRVSILATTIGLLFFILAVFMARVDLAQSFIFAMGMIVAFVPEGMLPTVTLALAMGVQRMARRNALVKRLSSVETLGSTTVICTDKTGTLTQNEMTVTAIWAAGHNLSVTGNGYSPQGEIKEDGQALEAVVKRNLEQLLIAAALCNDARLLPPDNETPYWREIGDPTEAALEVAALKGGLDLKKEAGLAPRLRELPFDSHRKRMSTIHAYQGNTLAYVKGAPKEVLALCTSVQLNGQAYPLDEAQRGRIMAANDEYASSGLRVLAVARRNLPKYLKEYTREAVECDLTFLGLIAMMDPPRAEVAEAVAKCHIAGIRIVMITGDYELTAQSIAYRLGITRSAKSRVITGSQLDTLNNEQLKQALRDEIIFARVTPEHKLRVVATLQEMGHIVAATGDGVNDAPALKKADIGVAMGLAGTDVAKEASDMILTDDNFASIVNAIEEGRAIFSNIRKFAVYVFNSNMAEAVPFVLMLFSQGAIPLPLTIMQVLAIDLGTDMVPAIGLGAEMPEKGVMEQPPRSQKTPLLSTGLLLRALLWYGLIESVASISAYFFLNWRYGWPGQPLAPAGTHVYMLATTITLAGVVATQIGAVMGCRSERQSIFRLGFTTNPLVLLGIGVELALLATIVYLPFAQVVFNTAPLDQADWLFVFAWTPVILLLDELRKLWLRWKDNQQAVIANQAAGSK